MNFFLPSYLWIGEDVQFSREGEASSNEDARTLTIREQAVRRKPLERSSLFKAKYVPFGRTDTDEQYDLDEVIYR